MKDRVFDLCAPVVNHSAVTRLKNVTFLGILSPKFFNETNSPLKKLLDSETTDDGSRYDHSVGVALLMLSHAEHLMLSENSKRYAICWGLLHDISTWPLSHTGEAAFSATTKISSHELRQKMILGDASLPKKWRLNGVLEDSGVNPTNLLMLFDKKFSKKLDEELGLIWEIIHSPITPDTIEGIWRAGIAYNVLDISPENYQGGFSKNLFGLTLNKETSKAYVDFWKKKGEVYSKIINDKAILQWESAWSMSIAHYFERLDLEASFEIDESSIIKEILKKGLLEPNGLFKYKKPNVYFVKGSKRKINAVSINQLSNYLIKEEI